MSEKFKVGDLAQRRDAPSPGPREVVRVDNGPESQLIKLAIGGTVTGWVFAEDYTRIPAREAARTASVDAVVQS